MTITLTRKIPTKPGHYFIKRPRDYWPKFVHVMEISPGHLTLIGPGTDVPFSQLTGKEKWSKRIEFDTE